MIALICARGGSKGVPNKNIRALSGKPLIAWAIGQALAVPVIERVIVSTDSEEIARVSRDNGAEVPFMRPVELAGDRSPEWLVWRHAIEQLRLSGGSSGEAIAVVPATAPLRSPEDIAACIECYEKGGVDVVISVTEAHRSPYFNMVRVDENGLAGLVIPPRESVVRRQDAPRVYDMATVAYVARCDFVMKSQGIFEGRVRAVCIPTERSLDIDSLLDFEIAEYLVSRGSGRQ